MFFSWTGHKWNIFFSILLWNINSYAQDCPPNIGFEEGAFFGWQTSEGSLERNTGILSISAGGPTYDRHTIIGNTIPAEVDPYGLFPVTCPNGSDYSIRLGNEMNGSQAESVSYTFTIPANRNDYSIIYQYAVVIQDPNHPYNQLPKLSVTVTDITNRSSIISCGSFAYTSSDLPGLVQSEVRPDVFYKPWSAVTINLSGYAGRIIKLEFLTTDCSQGGHFGYAYVDVSEACTSPVTGNIYCRDARDITLTAPFGLKGYQWYNEDFSSLLGTENSLLLSPAPSGSTRYAVVLTPYAGFGCKDTLFTEIKAINEVLTLQINDPPKTCANIGVDLTAPVITAGSSPNMKFTYFVDPQAKVYVTKPRFVNTSGTYYIKAINLAGCEEIKPVHVTVVSAPSLNINSPPAVCFPSTVDITSPSVLGIASSDVKFSFWEDAGTSKPLINPDAIRQSGIYYIKATNDVNCYDIKSVWVEVQALPVVRINEPPDACGSINLTSSALVSGSSAGLSYTYWKDALATIPLENPGNVTTGGTYYIKGSTSIGCYDVKPIMVKINPLPEFVVNTPAPVNYPKTINIEDLFVRNTGDNYSYWIEAAAVTPLPDYRSLARGGTFYIKSENRFGCLIVKPVYVVINTPSQPEIFVPKAFAPLQAVNNRLYPILFEVNQILKFAIYNRWGVKVFETQDPAPENGWDGTHNNEIQFLETYTWYAEGLDINGKIVRRNGNTLLVR